MSKMLTLFFVLLLKSLHLGPGISFEINQEPIISFNLSLLQTKSKDTTSHHNIPKSHEIYTNLRHHHHSHAWGPHFEEMTITNATVKNGETAYLNCRVGQRENILVSWVRRKSDQLDVLTLGTKNHSSDPRFQSAFKYPNNWRLSIYNATSKDSGTYLCQISTHPPKVLEVQLEVEAPEVFILNPKGVAQPDVHYNEGSTLKLLCTVSKLKSKILNWYRNSELLNQDVIRGGISIKTDMSSATATSILQVAMVTRKDGGSYRCSAPPQNASVIVHIHVNGENPAELYGNGQKTRYDMVTKVVLTVNVVIYYIILITASDVSLEQ